MSKINILALGGLDEKNKSMYLIEIDSKIFIFDSGVHKPLNNQLGIEHLIPNLEYLELNKDKVKAIFLTQANYLKLGALNQILKFLPNLKIYGSRTTIESLKIFFKHVPTVNDWKTIIMTPEQAIEESGITVLPLTLSSSIPESFGYCLKTNDGNIIYASNYLFDTINEFAIEPFHSLDKIVNQKNLLFLSDSLNMSEIISLNASYKITKRLEGVFYANKKIVIAIYEDEIINIVEAINLAQKHNYRVSITSPKLFALLTLMMKNKVINSYPINYLNLTNRGSYKQPNELIIVSEIRTTLYQLMNSLLESIDNNFYINENHYVVIAAPPQAGNEHHFADLINNISKFNLDLLTFNIDDKYSTSPFPFDLRNYLAIIKPNYFMPIQGYYKELVSAKKVALSVKMREDNIIIADNGEIHSFQNGGYKGIISKVKNITGVVIEEFTEAQIKDDLILERLALGKDGIILISALYDNAKKEIVSNFDIQMKGVIVIKNQTKLLSLIEDTVKTILKNSEANVNSLKLKSVLNKELTKLLRNSIKKVPLIFLNLDQIN